MPEDKVSLEQLHCWQIMLRDGLVVRSALAKDFGAMRFRIEMMFMGEKQRLYYAVAQRDISKGHPYMHVEKYEGPISAFAEDLFDQWYRRELLAVAHEWLNPVLHVASLSLGHDTNCWAFYTDASPLFMHYYGMIYEEIGPGNANDKYPPRKDVPEADWHTFSRHFDAFLKQQEQQLFEKDLGKIVSY